MYTTALLLAFSAFSAALPQSSGSGDTATTQAASCPAQPAGAGPMTTPDTDSAFLANPVYQDTANNAATPSGYIQSYANLNGATSGSGYLGYSAITSYNTQQCANTCAQTPGCKAFNIYFERDPSVDPGPNCATTNPTSTVNIKCSYWGSPVTASGATNTGQYRNQFHVVIAGSNGYSLASTQVAQPPCTSNAGLNLYYYGAGYLKDTTRPYPDNMKQTYTLPNTGNNDVCQAFNFCLRGLNNGIPESLEIYRTSPTAPFVCVAFESKNSDPTQFSVASSGVVAYGWSK